MIKSIPLKYLFILLCILTAGLCCENVSAQVPIGSDLSEIDYSKPKEYEIGGITVSGAKYVDKNVLTMLSGLRVGKTIKVPGDDIAGAIRKLWEQGMFEDVEINRTNVIGNQIFLEIVVKEKPRVSKFSFTGVKKSEADEIRNRINLTRGDVATEHLVVKTTRIIEDYFYDKGFLNTKIDIEQKNDTTRDNYVDLVININKGKKVRISQINIIGNEELSDAQVRSAMKETKVKGQFDPLNPLGPLVVNTVWDVVRLKPLAAVEKVESYFIDNYRPQIFKSSKWTEGAFKDDKAKIIDRYNSKGFRDARIVRDSIYKIDDENIGIDIVVEEGEKYHYRNITWTGNTKYSSEVLNEVLGIRSGDVYNKELLNANLNYSETSLDISSLYMDDGYLFFRVDPVEVAVENDSIDLEIRLHEGDQARISSVSVSGNTKTNDHVVIREMYSRPGQLFSRSDITRTVREMATLQYFNAETLQPDVKPNYSDGTVDIQYVVEESSSDQIELSAGWGYDMLMLSIGLSFNNFSVRNMFKKDAWKPIPGGDGQKVSLRVQTYGTNYIYYGASFTEPWLGGRKANALTVSLYQSYYSTNHDRDSESFGWFRMTGLTFGLGKRLTWPDDFFTLYQGINFLRYNTFNYNTGLNFGSGTGKYNLISYNVLLGRSSVSQPIYPRNGSEFQLSLEFTPPYSLFRSNVDYASMPDEQKYKWIEMYKWKFKAGWFTELYDKLVLMTRIRFGFMGCYNQDIGITPFGRFYLGGDGLASSYTFDSREIIGMRGYTNESLSPGKYTGSDNGGNIFAKYTMELRYPLSLNPQATIYALTFVEAGNDWLGFDTFNPFEVYRTAGLGVRIYLPMFGLLGLDWGYGFDSVKGSPSASGSQFHFSINSSID